MKRLLLLLLAVIATPLLGQAADPRGVDNLEVYLTVARLPEDRNADCTGSGTPYSLCTGVGTGSYGIVQNFSVATCATQSCLDNETEFSDLSTSFCDTDSTERANNVGYAGVETDSSYLGCVRWLEDQNGCEREVDGGTNCHDCTSDSPACQPVGDLGDEWVTGLRVAQDDTAKAIYVSGCINGLPCIRGELAANMHTEGVALNQPGCFETSAGQQPTAAGDFTLVYIVRPRSGVSQTTPYYLTGEGIKVSATGELIGRFSTSDVDDVTLSGAGALGLDDSWHYIEMQRSGTALAASVDRVDVTSGSPTSSDQVDMRYFMANNCNPGGIGFLGDFAAFAMWSRALTPTELQNVYDFFNSEFALAAPPQVSGASFAGATIGGQP